MRRALLRTTLISAVCLAAAAASAADTRYYGGTRHSGYYVPPEDRAENRIIPMYGDLPTCDDPAVLGKITSGFDSRESTYWGPLRAVAYDHIRPLGYRPWGDAFIPRRFCTGRIALNDGSLRRVDYSVRENLGLFGWTWDVNWCVNGLDRHLTYAPGCKMARP